MNNKEFKQETPPLAKILVLVLANWYWFVLSLGLCLSAGYLYSKTIPYQFRASALILIKGGEGRSNQFSTESSAFADLGVSNGVNSTENEIVMLRSSSLLKNVAEKLNLTVSYTVKPLMREADIYGANPVAVTVIETQDNFFKFTIKPNSLDSFMYGQENEFETAKFGDTITVNNTKLTVHTTAFWGNSYTHSDITVSSLPLDLYAKIMAYRLLVSRVDNITTSVMLLYEDNNKKRAEDVLNTLIEVYNQSAIDQKNEVAQNTEHFIADRINMIYADLGEVDGKLEEFKKEHKIVDFANVTSMAYQYQSNYISSLNDINLQITLIESIKPSIEQNNSDEFKVIAINKVYTDLGITEQINSYNALVLKYADLAKNSGAKNPILLKLKDEIIASKANMQIAIDNILVNLNLRKQEVLSQEEQINNQISSLPTKERVVRDVMREQKIKEQLYLYLLNKREANALQLAIAESNASIIEPAEAPRLPATPNIPIIMLIAGVVGLLLPALGIFIKSLFDNKIYSKSDVQKYSLMPVIGVLPRKSKDQQGKEVIVDDTSRDPLTEAFRVVRSNIDFFTIEHANSGQVIQLSSCTSGEGKTFVSVNMALSIANTNKKVLLMDLDLRRKGLSNILTKNHNELGVTAYLSGKIDNLKDIIHTFEQTPQLDYIPVGALPPNATNLLSSVRFRQMIESLKADYEYIVIDSAPYLVVADSQIINKYVDMTIWVLRSGVLPKAVLTDIAELYEANKVKNMSILISDMDFKNNRYGYGYGYGANKKGYR